MAELPDNLFKKAVYTTPDIKSCYRSGLKALGTHSSKISVDNTFSCNGSVNIDECVKAKYPVAQRWDYCFGYKNCAYFVEVHPAATSDVGKMLEKLQWLKNWLKTQAADLDAIKASIPYYWVHTGKYDITPTSRQSFQVAKAGIKPIAKLTL